jgi:hypothetical protein
MADNEMLNKWIGALTPRRAIHTFFENASPEDSPNPEDIFEPPAVNSVTLFDINMYYKGFVTFRNLLLLKKKLHL